MITRQVLDHWESPTSRQIKCFLNASNFQLNKMVKQMRSRQHLPDKSSGNWVLEILLSRCYIQIPPVNSCGDRQSAALSLLWGCPWSMSSVHGHCYQGIMPHFTKNCGIPTPTYFNILEKRKCSHIICISSIHSHLHFLTL